MDKQYIALLVLTILTAAISFAVHNAPAQSLGGQSLNITNVNATALKTTFDEVGLNQSVLWNVTIIGKAYNQTFSSKSNNISLSAKQLPTPTTNYSFIAHSNGVKNTPNGTVNYQGVNKIDFTAINGTYSTNATIQADVVNFTDQYGASSVAVTSMNLSNATATTVDTNQTIALLNSATPLTATAVKQIVDIYNNTQNVTSEHLNITFGQLKNETTKQYYIAHQQLSYAVVNDKNLSIVNVSVTRGQPKLIEGANGYTFSGVNQTQHINIPLLTNTGCGMLNMQFSVSELNPLPVVYQIKANNVNIAGTLGLNGKANINRCLPIGQPINLTIYSGENNNYSAVDPSTIITLIPIGNVVTITLKNNQAAQTNSTFQELLIVNSLKYQQYEAPNNNNTAFFYPNGTSINAWMEANNTNTAKATIWFVKLIASIPASSSANIEMGWYPPTTNFDGVLTGELANLSATYGAYDNGAQVFPFYDSFIGTTLSGTLWNAQSNADKANTIINNGATILNSINSQTTIQTVNQYNAINATLEFDMKTTPSGSANANILIGYFKTCTTPCAQYIYMLTSGGPVAGQYRYRTANSLSNNFGQFTPSGSPPWNIFSMGTNSPQGASNSISFVANYAIGQENTIVFTKSPNNAIADFIGSNYITFANGKGDTFNSIKLNFVRQRYLPPFNIFPSTTFSAVQQVPVVYSLTVTPTVPKSLQSAVFSTSWTLTTGPYNVIYTISNSIAQCTSFTANHVAGPTNTFTFTFPASCGTGAFVANVQVIDSQNPNVIGGNMLSFSVGSSMTVSTLTPKQSAIVGGGTVALASTWSGGVPPYNAVLWTSGTRNPCNTSFAHIITSTAGLGSASVTFATVSPLTTNYYCAIVTDSVGTVAAGPIANIIVQQPNYCSMFVNWNNGTTSAVTCGSSLTVVSANPNPTITYRVGRTLPTNVYLLRSNEFGTKMFANGIIFNYGGLTPNQTVNSIQNNQCESTNPNPNNVAFNGRNQGLFYVAYFPNRPNERTTFFQNPYTYFYNPVTCGPDFYFTWNMIETQQGVFNWTLTDAIVNNAINAGNKVALTFEPQEGGTSGNERLPFWFTQANPTMQCGGIQTLEAWTGNFASSNTLDNPSSWYQFIQAILNHYGYNPDIAYIKTGVTADEMKALTPTTVSNAVCVNLLFSSGYTNSIWTSYSGNYAAVLNSLNSTTISPYVAGDNGGLFTNAQENDQYNAIMSNGIGIFTGSYQASKSNPPYGLAGTGPFLCTNSLCNTTLNWGGKILLGGQNLLQSCVNGQPDACISPQTGPVNALLLQAIHNKTNVYELYPEDIQIAFNASNTIGQTAFGASTANIAYQTAMWNYDANVGVGYALNVSYTTLTPTSNTYWEVVMNDTQGGYGLFNYSYAPTQALLFIDPPMQANIVTVSNTQINRNQFQTLNAVITYGAGPYTYDFVVTNTINGDILANNLVTTSSPSNVFSFKIKNAADWAGTLAVTVNVLDSVGEKVSDTNTMTARGAPFISSFIFASVIDEGFNQSINISLHGGFSPWTYNYLVYNATGVLVASYVTTNTFGTNSFFYYQNPVWKAGIFTVNVILTDNATTPVSNSVLFTYIVGTPGPPTITTSSNESALGSNFIVTAYANPLSDGVQLYLNGMLINSGTGVLTNTINATYLGYWNITAHDEFTLVNASVNQTIYVPVYIQNVSSIFNLTPSKPVISEPPAITYSSDTTLSADVHAGMVKVDCGVTLTTNGYNIYVVNDFNSLCGTVETGLAAGTGGTIGFIDGGNSTYGLLIEAANVMLGNLQTNAQGGAVSIAASNLGNGGPGGATLLVGGTAGNPTAGNGQNAAGTALTPTLLRSIYVSGVKNALIGGGGGAGGGNGGTNGQAGQSFTSSYGGSGGGGSGGCGGTCTVAGGGGGAGSVIIIYRGQNYTKQGTTILNGGDKGAASSFSGVGGNGIIMTYSFNVEGGKPIPVRGLYYPFKIYTNSSNIAVTFNLSNSINFGATQTAIQTNVQNLNFLPSNVIATGVYSYNIIESQLSNSVKIIANFTVNATDVTNALVVPYTCYQYLPCLTQMSNNAFTVSPLSWSLISVPTSFSRANQTQNDIFSTNATSYYTTLQLNYNFTKVNVSFISNPALQQSIPISAFAFLTSNTGGTGGTTRPIINFTSYDQRTLTRLTTNTTLQFNILVNNYTLGSQNLQFLNSNTFVVYISNSIFQNALVKLSNITTTTSQGPNYVQSINNFCGGTVTSSPLNWRAYLVSSSGTIGQLTTINIQSNVGGQNNGDFIKIIGGVGSGSFIAEQLIISGQYTTVPLIIGQTYAASILSSGCSPIYTTGTSIQTTTWNINIPLLVNVTTQNFPQPTATCSVAFNSMNNANTITCSGTDTKNIMDYWRVEIYNSTGFAGSGLQLIANSVNLVGHNFTWSYFPISLSHGRITYKILGYWGGTTDPGWSILGQLNNIATTGYSTALDTFLVIIFLLVGIIIGNATGGQGQAKHKLSNTLFVEAFMIFLLYMIGLTAWLGIVFNGILIFFLVIVGLLGQRSEGTSLIGG